MKSHQYYTKIMYKISSQLRWPYRFYLMVDFNRFFSLGVSILKIDFAGRILSLNLLHLMKIESKTK